MRGAQRAALLLSTTSAVLGAGLISAGVAQACVVDGTCFTWHAEYVNDKGEKVAVNREGTFLSSTLKTSLDMNGKPGTDVDLTLVADLVDKKHFTFTAVKKKSAEPLLGEVGIVVEVPKGAGIKERYAAFSISSYKPDGLPRKVTVDLYLDKRATQQTKKAFPPGAKSLAVIVQALNPTKNYSVHGSVFQTPGPEALAEKRGSEKAVSITYLDTKLTKSTIGIDLPTSKAPDDAKVTLENNVVADMEVRFAEDFLTTKGWHKLFAHLSKAPKRVTLVKRATTISYSASGNMSSLLGSAKLGAFDDNPDEIKHVRFSADGIPKRFTMLLGAKNVLGMGKYYGLRTTNPIRPNDPAVSIGKLNLRFAGAEDALDKSASPKINRIRVDDAAPTSAPGGTALAGSVHLRDVTDASFTTEQALKNRPPVGIFWKFKDSQPKNIDYRVNLKGLELSGLVDGPPKSAALYPDLGESGKVRFDASGETKSLSLYAQIPPTQNPPLPTIADIKISSIPKWFRLCLKGGTGCAKNGQGLKSEHGAAFSHESLSLSYDQPDKAPQTVVDAHVCFAIKFAEDCRLPPVKVASEPDNAVFLHKLKIGDMQFRAGGGVFFTKTGDDVDSDAGKLYIALDNKRRIKAGLIEIRQKSPGSDDQHYTKLKAPSPGLRGSDAWILYDTTTVPTVDARGGKLSCKGKPFLANDAFGPKINLLGAAAVAGVSPCTSY